MGLAELLLIALGLSMDAFAVALCLGLPMKRVSFEKSLTVGLYFGVFQAAMPLAGYFVGSVFAEKIMAFEHWVAFGLLSIIGGKMIWESIQDGGDKRWEEASLRFADMLPLAVATSVDALAVGVSFAFLQVSVAPAVILIGTVTLTLSMLGVKLGSIFGMRYKSRAELSGGIVLVLIGTKILLEHLGILVI